MLMHSRFFAEKFKLFGIYLLSTIAASTGLVGQAEDAWNTSSLRLAIAIRYLQIHGVSHSHIYLYRGNGKLLRQLTHDESGQDCDPIFSPDGSEVVFKRARNTGDEFWSIKPDGTDLRHLDQAPQWYAQTISEKPPRFDYPAFVPLPSDPSQQRLADYIKAGEVAYKAPDNSVAIVLKDRSSEADPAQDWYPKNLYLHMHIALLRQHRGSTFCERFFALDLNTRRLYEVTPKLRRYRPVQ